MIQNDAVENCPEFNSPGQVAGVCNESPFEPPEQKPEAGNSLPGHGAHSMQFLWPWARHRHLTGQVQAAAIHIYFTGVGKAQDPLQVT